MDRPDTFIQHVLWRLCLFCAASLVVIGDSSPVSAQLSSAQLSSAQLSSGQGSNAQNVYTIIGDVQLPATYPWIEGRRVSLQMLLERAGALGQSGKAVIRKASEPERAVIETVRSGNARDIYLAPQDIIIWQSVAGSNPLSSPRVVVLTDRGPMLQLIQPTGVDLSTVLRLVGLPTHQTVLVHRSEWGRTQSFPMTGRSLVQRGDVLDVRTGVVWESTAGRPAVGVGMQSSVGMQSRGGMQSSVGMQGNLRTVSSPTTVPEALPPSPGNRHSVPPEPSSGLKIPGDEQNPASESSRIETQPRPLSEAAAPLQIPNDGYESSDPAEHSRTADYSRTADHSRSDTANVETTESISSTMAGLDDLADEVLQPGSSTEEAESFALMNGVFLFGLVLAIGLITIGIVRTRQEQRFHDQMRVYAEPASYSTSPGIEPQSSTDNADVLPLRTGHHSPDSCTQLPVFSPEPSTAPQIVADTESVEPAGTEFEPVESQVESQVETDVELENCPVLSVGLEKSEFANEAQQAGDRPHQWGSADVVTEVPSATTWLTDEGENAHTADAHTAAAHTADAENDAVDREVAAVSVREARRPVDSRSPASDESLVDEDADAPILQLPDVDALRRTLTRKTAAAASTETSKSATKKPVLDSQSTHTVPAEGVAAANEGQPTEADPEVAADSSVSSRTPLELAQALQNQDENMDQPSMTKAEADYLEDLIQNRLPLELSDAQLPLRISLFGKPEGPRRLRIDAAHASISPPHMARPAGRANRREPVMAVAAKKSQQQEQQHSAEIPASSSGPQTTASDNSANQKPDRPAQADSERSATTSSQEPTSGLDKALNFLEEQSKS